MYIWQKYYFKLWFRLWAIVIFKPSTSKQIYIFGRYDTVTYDSIILNKL